MKSKFVKASCLVAFAISATNAVQARDFAEIYTQCGLGAMIAPNSEAVAAVTNVTWDLGTTAVSSNISSEETCRGGQKKVASLIHHAYPQLTADIAKGQGIHLTALSDAAQCDQTVNRQFQLKVRNDFASLNVLDAEKSQATKNEELFGLVNSAAKKLGCAI